MFRFVGSPTIANTPSLLFEDSLFASLDLMTEYNENVDQDLRSVEKACTTSSSSASKKSKKRNSHANVKRVLLPSLTLPL